MRTGTRTVRGLEALSLSIPPTPGESIIKRKANEGLFSLADVFNEKGYKSEFIYGGYGYFDNMNYYFAQNGYEAVDRNVIAKKDIHTENVWGVADEDLFRRIRFPDGARLLQPREGIDGCAGTFGGGVVLVHDRAEPVHHGLLHVDGARCGRVDDALQR